MGRKKFAIDEPCILSFARLGALAMALLMIPNSNAAPKRTFSIVKKIFTEQYSQLGNSTLSALLKCKLNEDTEFYLEHFVVQMYLYVVCILLYSCIYMLFVFCCTAVSICCLYFVYLYISVFFIYVICTFHAVFTFIFINLSQNYV